jgi:hypothetical protein
MLAEESSITNPQKVEKIKLATLLLTYTMCPGFGHFYFGIDFSRHL